MTLRYFDPQPGAAELPDRLPSPFATIPHAIARRAADLLVAQLRAAQRTGEGSGEGKMFGVLVVADDLGQIGYLRAFSGMFEGRWDVDGFVGPVFDHRARDAFWPAGEAELAAIDDELRAAIDGAAPARVALAALDDRHAAEDAALRSRHVTNRTARHAARAALADAGGRQALDQQSRGDAAERRRLDSAHQAARTLLAVPLRTLDERIAALAARRSERSRHYLRRIHDTYAFANARGERTSLPDLFAPDAPPGGAGDCAAPKLFAHAYRAGLRPIALAELWWGAPPATGGRLAGNYYPACRGKCGPILAHVLGGLAAEAAPIFGGGPITADQPRTVFEDAWLVVVDKPVGLLSVPGRSGQLRDSVATRLRARYPDATGPLVVHRLDLDTSGLLLAAKDADTHALLQRLFARREITKRYVAWLAGELAGDHGTIDLALRVDLEDRPRQIHDPVHGKSALTEWTVLERRPGRTRIALIPHTGRTHQLRVHCAHALGLGTPIAGDRLYGRTTGDDARLLLHAHALAFVHPRTGLRLELASPLPF